MALFNVIMDIAAKTTSFESAITRVERRFETLTSLAKSATGVLGGLFAFHGIEEFVRGTLEAGEAMAQAAQKAGVGVAAFSQLGYAAKLSNVSLEALSQGFKKMEIAVSKGDAVEAFRAIGVSVERLRQLNPDQQFQVIAEALSKMGDAADRARAVRDIFGKGGDELLPVLLQGAKGIQALRDEADQLGITLDEVGAQSLVRAKESMEKLDASSSALGRTLVEKLGPALTATEDGIRKMLGGSTNLEKLQDELARVKARLADIANGTQFHRGFGDTKKELEELRTRAIELSNALVKIYTAQIKSTDTSFVDAVLGKPEGFKQRGQEIQEVIVTVQRASTDSLLNYYVGLEKATQTDLQKRSQDERDFYADLEVLAESHRVSAADIQARADEHREKAALVLKEKLIAIDERANQNLDDLARTLTPMQQMAQRAAQNMESVFEQFFFDPFHSGIQGLLSGFINVVRQMIAQAAAAQLAKTLFGSGGSNIFGTILGAVFGGGGGGSGAAAANSGVVGPRAGGGSVMGGGTYLVGEQGPELFTPRNNGNIIPNGALGGDRINITINSPVDARGAQEGQAAQLARVMKANNESVKQDIIEGLRRRKYRV